MTKQKKIDFINQVNAFFLDARNHGNDGGSWWYPTQNRIAYNVKMRAWVDIDDVRKLLTPLQNDTITDDDLYQIFEDNRGWTCEQLIDDIEEKFGLESGFAGRSGGWIEVDFENNLVDDFEGYTAKEVDTEYKEALKLEKLEGDVREFIEKSHKEYNDYVSSQEYLQDIKTDLLESEVIQDDKDILHDMKMSTSLESLITHKNETIRRHAQGINKIL